MSIDNLPPGWARVRLDDTGKYINGFAFRPHHRESTGLPIIRIQNLTDETKPLNRTKIQVPQEFEVLPGDMLVSWSATLDVYVWLREKALVNQHIFKVVPDERLIVRSLLFYWLKLSIEELQKTEHLHGSTMKHINRGPFLAHEVPLPPLTEQTRIVQKLEELLIDLDAGVAELKAAQKKLAQYRQSLLKAAVDGSLTAEWRDQNTPTETGAQLLIRILQERRVRWEAKQRAKFKDQGKVPPRDWQKKYPVPVQPNTSELAALPQGWVWASVDQLTDEQKYGSSSKTNEGTGGVPILRMGNIQDGALDFSNLKYLSADHDEFPGLHLHDGDMIFNRTNSPELVGKSAVFRSQISPCSFASYLIRVRFSADYIPELASTFMNSAYGRRWIKSVVVQQVGQANVNGTKLSALAVPLPPFYEQVEIIARLNAQLSLIVEQLQNVEVSFKHSAAQRQNILRAAFTGQLVPQDPNDEPASVLLARTSSDQAGDLVKKRRGAKLWEAA